MALEQELPGISHQIELFYKAFDWEPKYTNRFIMYMWMDIPTHTLLKQLQGLL